MVKLAYSLMATLIDAQSDGNPFGWDRARRCDHIDYDPPCGPCEGVGGIAKSDKADDISIAACEVVGVQDAFSLKRPVWGPDFSVVSHEILIGKKNDVACFQAFPSNDSTAAMCYKPQEVVLYNEMRDHKALILTANQKQYIFGNVSSTIYHQGGNMWIANVILGSIKQTICTAPREGGDPSKPAVNAVQYNWTDNLFYIATERIDVEYGVGLRTLDHWAFGPHHAWTEPETGLIVRMWQPFNGLQIFEPGTWEEGTAVQRAGGLFDELSPDGSKPPRAALPGGSLARINCADDGFYTDMDRPPVMADTVCIVNHAAFAMNFDAQNTRTEEWFGKTDTYPVNKQRCLELGAVNGGVQENDLFEAKVSAIGGRTNSVDRLVQFTPGWTATFVCRGTTLSFQCALLETRPSDGGERRATLPSSAPLGHALADASDLRRARTKIPRSTRRGTDFSTMGSALNRWLLDHAPRSQDCETWTVHELQELQSRLLLLRDPTLDEVYQEAQDSRRLPTDLDEIAGEWRELNELASSDPELARMHRDGHCHETVMWYVHHLPESLKLRLKEEIALPLLPATKHQVQQTSSEHAAHRVGKAYEYKVSCASCHAAVFPEPVLVV